MCPKRREEDFIERRRYARLDHIFPVEFLFLDEAGRPLSDWHQGFTQDISRGGICLIVNQLQPEELRLLADKKNSIELNIHIPLKDKAIRALVRFAWFKKLKSEPVRQYAIGVSYEDINPKDNNRILRYVTRTRFLKIFAFGFVILLSAGLLAAGFFNTKLRLENEKLVSSLSEQFASYQALIKARDSLRFQTRELKFSLSQSEAKISALQTRLSQEKRRDPKAATALELSIGELRQYQSGLQQGLSDLSQKKVKVDLDIVEKGQKATLLETRITEKMYKWLTLHQNNITGLVASFEGDKNLQDWGFTYDQALAAIVFVSAGEPQKAKRIFDFYQKAEKLDGGGFANAYYISDGDVAEYVAHAGPNIWLGLAVLQYTRKTKDDSYLGLASDVANWLQTLKDKDNGIRGGRELTWYSTEHNLDAYAFYHMLYELTQREFYDKRAKETLQWLNKNAYSMLTKPIVKRGKGDSTIATDTYAWSITAIGPKTLKSADMDPDGIMDFAIDNCGVQVEYQGPRNNSISVKGFDFEKNRNLPRGGVISCEWTAQMILAFKVMADYHRQEGNIEKAKYYNDLADFYVSELSKMIIVSASALGQGGFCLPYASQDSADTGHGWRTPQGEKTGSVAATAYAILAFRGYNPLNISEQ